MEAAVAILGVVCLAQLMSIVVLVNWLRPKQRQPEAKKEEPRKPMAMYGGPPFGGGAVRDKGAN